MIIDLIFFWCVKRIRTAKMIENICKFELISLLGDKYKNNGKEMNAIIVDNPTKRNTIKLNNQNIKDRITKIGSK